MPAGEDGEIVVRGPLVFLGYDGQPDVTAHTFRGGWHHTGDIGRFDDEGNLYYVARKPEKELIKPGGENVYPAEVEAAILELDAVRAVCVFGVSDDRWGEAIRAVVEADPDAGLDQEAVREHVGSSIARFKRPRDVIFTSELPRSDGDQGRPRRRQGPLGRRVVHRGGTAAGWGRPGGSPGSRTRYSTCWSGSRTGTWTRWASTRGS